LKSAGDHTTTERVTHQLVGCRVLERILCPYLRPESRPILWPLLSIARTHAHCLPYLSIACHLPPLLRPCTREQLGRAQVSVDRTVGNDSNSRLARTNHTANLSELVLGCIEAEYCNHMFILQCSFFQHCNQMFILQYSFFQN
jgi:hypothetical protein